MLLLAACAHAPLEAGASSAASLAECASAHDDQQQILRCRNRELGVREGVRGSLANAFSGWVASVQEKAPVQLAREEVTLSLDGASYPGVRFVVTDAGVVRSEGYFLLAPARGGQRWIWCSANELRPRVLAQCRDDLAAAVREQEVEQPAKVGP